MAKGNFPKRIQIRKKGKLGEAHFDYFVTKELGWLYHRVDSANDYGIDGYVEIIDDEKVTGKLIGVQIKHGNSFFKKESSSGYEFTGKAQHLNYYLNSSVPVILIILDDSFERKAWGLFEVSRTLQKKQGWSMEILKNSPLERDFVDAAWRHIAGSIMDFEPVVRTKWSIDHMLYNVIGQTVAIPRQDIIDGNFTYISEFLNRLSKTYDHLLKKRSSLEIFFPAYDEDHREIHEIPEVCSWLKRSIEYGIPWFYFLDYKGRGSSLSLLLFAYAGAHKEEKRPEGQVLGFDLSKYDEFIKINFLNLNRFTARHNIDIEINKEISLNVFAFYQKNMTLI